GPRGIKIEQIAKFYRSCTGKTRSALKVHAECLSCISWANLYGMRSLGYVELIRERRNFRNLLAGQFISELGNWFNFIAGLGLVRVVSAASPKAAGLLFVCRIVPFALLAPIAGTLVDRFSRRSVMIVTDLSRAALALLFL